MRILKFHHITKLKTQYVLQKGQLLFIVLATVCLSCESLKTAVFDQYSYQQAISIKVEGMHLMDDATQSYNTFEVEVEELLLTLEKMVEYEKNKPNNDITYTMWKTIANKDKHLLAGFFKRWKADDQLSAAFTREAKQQVSEALDLIIKYEAQKNKTNGNNILNFLNNN